MSNNGTQTDVLVIGGGPAGMMAAIRASIRGLKVVLLEQNEKLGKKLYITGKGRCNVTAEGTIDELIAAMIRNGRFMHSALSQFDNQDLKQFIEAQGVPLKVERGGRVFPVSDKSSDIIAALRKALEHAGVEVRLHSKVRRILTDGEKVTGLEEENGNQLSCRAVILATGGRVYPLTGSTGDGYRMAKELGHSVIPCSPSLTGIHTDEIWPRLLQGLSLKNVSLSLVRANRPGKPLYSEVGEMLFTHQGVSGPLVLTASAYISGNTPEDYRLALDMKPGLDHEKLDARILRDIQGNINREIDNTLPSLIPSSMVPVVLELSDIPVHTGCNAITREQRRRLGETLKAMTMTPVSLGGMDEAIITRGGVKCAEVDPYTMESKKVAGLYLTGELLDVDAMTGGYNLQIAFSTGYAAGNNCLL